MKLVCCAILAAAVSCCGPADRAYAQKRTAPKSQAAPGPANYKSNFFLLHTDLSPSEANELLERLEQMLGLISTYWGRPPKKVIECYVVKDLSLWPENSLLPEGRAKIAAGAGVTLSRTTSVGGEKVDADAVVFAVADRGTPQHEAVHAYCALTFGTTGPTWYSEGMAEMGQYWRKNQSDVQIHDGVLKYLQASEPEPMSRIVDVNQVTGDSWQNYAWRWALCHLLANNPNYADRFRPLGLGLLAEQPVSFEQTYGAMANEISFEYLFFLEHIEQGLRADLIAWDWSKKFLPLKTSQKAAASVIQARRGWQPSGLTVEAGVEYRLKSTGSWKITKDGEAITADGAEADLGRLEGVIFDDWKLGESIPLGAQGVFKAPSSGDLYLRCRDEWTQLADNSGKMSVRLNYIGAAKDAAAPVFQSTVQPAQANRQAPAGEFRTWKDVSGAFEIEAKLISATTTEVELQKQDGSKIKVPLKKLSAGDRKFIEASPRE